MANATAGIWLNSAPGKDCHLVLKGDDGAFTVPGVNVTVTEIPVPIPPPPAPPPPPPGEWRGTGTPKGTTNNRLLVKLTCFTAPRKNSDGSRADSGSVTITLASGPPVTNPVPVVYADEP